MNKNNPLQVLYGRDRKANVLLKFYPEAYERLISIDGLETAYESIKRTKDLGMIATCMARSFVRSQRRFYEGGRLLFAWADIQFGKDALTPCTFPPTQVEAQSLLSQFLLPPSLVLQTKAKLQSFWLLDRPMYTRSEIERLQAQTLLMRLHDYFAVLAAEAGWQNDNSCNLMHQITLAGATGPRPIGKIELANVLESRPDCRYSAGAIEAACEVSAVRNKAVMKLQNKLNRLTGQSQTPYLAQSQKSRWF